MADKNSQGKNKSSDTDGPSKGTNPANDGGAGGGFDPTKLGDGDLNRVLEDPRIWKTERLAGLLSAKKELKKLKDSAEEAEKKKLEKQGEFKKLLEKTQSELEKANARIGELALERQIANAVTAKGVQDVDAAVKLIDRSAITKDEAGNFTGVTEAVDGLIQQRPYLVSNQQSVGSPTNPSAPGSQVKKFKLSEIQDPAFYNEHHEEIKKAQIEGRIEDDRPTVFPTAGQRQSPGSQG